MEMSERLTGLEDAMLMHMESIIHDDHRPVSFLDLMHFEVEGREYTMTHGTCRNKLSKLTELGIIEFAYNAGIAFYTLKGVHLGNKANLMTPPHTGVQVLLQHVHRVPNIKKHPLYRCIKHHPFDKAAVHDLHLKFIADGLWSILNNNSLNSSHVDGDSSGTGSSLCVLQPDPFSKDIRLGKRAINDLDIQVTVHHTDTVTV